MIHYKSSNSNYISNTIKYLSKLLLIMGKEGLSLILASRKMFNNNNSNNNNRGNNLIGLDKVLMIRIRLNNICNKKRNLF